MSEGGTSKTAGGWHTLNALRQLRVTYPLRGWQRVGHPLLCLLSLPSYFLKCYPARVQPKFKPKAVPPAMFTWELGKDRRLGRHVQTKA